MAGDNKIGVDIELSATDKGATGVVKEVADHTRRIVQEVTAGDRAMGGLDRSLRSLSVVQLREVEARLQAIVATGGAGINTDAYQQQLARLQEQIARLEAGGGNGGGEADGALGGLRERLGELGEEIPGVGGALGTLGEITEAVATGPMAVAALAVGGLTAGIGLAKAGVEEFMGAEVTVSKLDAALAESGQLTDEFREKLQGLAGDLEEATGIDDDVWMSGLGRLAQFGANDDNIERIAEGVKNLAGIMGGDVEGASKMMGRALQGNFQQFSRLGIEVSKTGTDTEKLDGVMQQLAARGGGQLEVTTKTIVGQFTALANASGDVLKGIGNLISQSGVLQATLGALTTVVSGVAGLFPSVIKQVDGLYNKLPDMSLALDDVGESAEGAGEGLENLSQHAKEVKDDMEAAIKAVVELRQQQDQLADAATAEALSDINVDEASGDISAVDAAQRRAKVRADAERAKFDRQLKEQDQIIEASSSRLGKAGGETSGAKSLADQAKEKFDQQRAAILAQYGGLAGISDVPESQIGPNADPYSALAKGQREKASRAESLAAENLRADKGKPVNAEAAARLTAEATQATKLAEAYEQLSAALVDSIKKRGAATQAAKEQDKIEKEVREQLDKATNARTAILLQQRSAQNNARADTIKAERDAERAKLEDDQKRIAHDLKSNSGMNAQEAAINQHRYDENTLRLNALKFGKDTRGLETANLTRELPPGAQGRTQLADERLKTIDAYLKDNPNMDGRMRDTVNRRRREFQGIVDADAGRGEDPTLHGQRDFNRRRDQRQKDQETFAGHPEQEVVSVAGRASNLTAGFNGGLGTVSGSAAAQVRATADKIAKQGGNDPALLGELLREVQTLSQIAQRLPTNTVSREDFDRTIAEVKRAQSNLDSRQKNSR